MDSHKGVLYPDTMKKNSTEAKWMVLASVSTGAFLASLDSSIVNISLPTLVRTFNTEFAFVQWVVLAYMVTVVSLILPLGRIGDIMGKKRIYLGGFVIFTAGSALCGTGSSLAGLIVYRVIQGIGASMIMALGFAIVTEAFPVKERGKAIGILSSLCAIAIALGPVLGGFLVDALAWQWIFLVNVPIGIAGCFMVHAHVPGRTEKVRETFGFSAAIALFVALISLFAGLTWGQVFGFTPAFLLVAGTVFMAGVFMFIRCEARATHPLIDVTLFSDRHFTINLVTGFFAFVAYAGVVLLLPFYLEEVAGYSTRRAGLFMAVIPVSLGLLSPMAGALSDRFGTRPVTLAGLCLSLIAYYAASSLDCATSLPGLVGRLVAIGAGMGLFMSPNNSAIMGSVSQGRLGIASGLLTAARTLGQAMGAAVVGALWVFSVSVHSVKTGGITQSMANHSVEICGFHDTFMGFFFLIMGGVVVYLWGDVIDTGVLRFFSKQRSKR